ncbi:MAG TPA: thiamine-phosphate kinase [Acidimicrobiales bacterium]|nr:thiamine-phosphate kinase [Acidimicrobiales bacterium]
MGEFAAIDRFRRMLPQPAAGETWIGDDAAVVAAPAGALLLTSDAVVAGVHADLDLVGLDDFGWKAVAAAVSDVAAMGGRPTHLLVSLCAPEGTDIDLLYAGVVAASSEYGCPVVGGDLSGASQLVVSVTVVGDAGAGAAPPVLRSGAGAGDTIFVTGPLGSSAAGLRRLREAAAHPAGSRDDPLIRAHRRPRARPAEGAAARAAGATAMIDVSDGLVADLRHLARASGTGVVVDTVPVADGAAEAEALAGGEDYELVFTAPDPGRVAAGFAAAGLPAPIAIGRCTGDPDERVLAGGPLPEGGWEHWV